MTLQHFALPDLGEGLTEAQILGWLVSCGDEVALNQPIVEVETAKAAVEVPSPWAGVVRELHAAEGDTVAVGARVISIDTGDVEHRAPEAAPSEVADMLVGYGPRPSPARRRRRAVPGTTSGSASALAAAPAPDVTVLAKPPVRKLARDLGVDLRTVSGSGPAGSITREDLGRHQHRVPVNGVRKAMAQAMTQSAFAVPQATVFLTVDATETVQLRKALAGLPDFTETPVTPLAVVARAVCVAARRAPLINSSWDDSRQEIVVHEQVNLGIAVATPRGLIVPNIKDAASLSVVELAAALAGLTRSAREGHTRPADLAGGTITITNVGVFGVDGGTPLLNPGESAILCIGAIRPQPWVHDGALAIRDVALLSMTFDHRIIDGQLASQFVADVGAMLTDPRLLLARA